MRISTIATLLLISSAVSIGRAQVSPTDLANQFPDVSAVETSFRDSLDAKLAMQYEMKADAVPNFPRKGVVAAFDSAVWDNLKGTVDLKYSNTLSSSFQQDTSNFSVFRLTGVQFVPTYSITYETKFSQFSKAWHQLHAGHTIQNGLTLSRNAELARLREAYADFEESRAEFSEALRANEAKEAEQQARASSEAAAELADKASAEVCRLVPDCARAKDSDEKCMATKDCTGAKKAQKEACSQLSACDSALKTSEAAKRQYLGAKDALDQAQTDKRESAFYKMKVKAIRVLTMGDYAGTIPGSSTPVLNAWQAARWQSK
ncbi:MAG TPA: hypothetical protein VGF08_05490 [Terriglobales bacterium]